MRLYSNEKVKFPNGHGMRQALAYKILDIILLISYRIGPEQTRVEMERVLRAFFDGFNQVKASLTTTTTTNLTSCQSPNTTAPASSNSISRTRSAFKARTSIVSFDQASSRRFLPGNGAGSTGASGPSDGLNTSTGLDSGNADLSDSFDEYLKFSYDQTTNEIVGSSLRPTQAASLAVTAASSVANKRLASSPESGHGQKYRQSSFGLLTQQDNENDG